MKIINLFFALYIMICNDELISLNSKKINVEIDSILMGKIDGDNLPSEFSVVINLTNHGEEISQWQLGFYMSGAPLTKLVSGNENFNPQIIRQICDNSNFCVALNYDTAQNISDTDLSQGYTSIHSPVQNFPLYRGKTYTIKFLHINQWGGANVSYFPQNFFLILKESDSERKNKKNIYQLKTNFNCYRIFNYDQKKTTNEIKERINFNWFNSLNPEKGIIKIVPLPVEIKTKQGKDFLLKERLHIYSDFKDSDDVLDPAIKALDTDLGILAIFNKEKSADIVIKQLTKPEILKHNLEGYILDIDDHRIVIKALTKTGVFYALQTLRQLWILGKKDVEKKVPQLHIIDYPRYKYRGILLDTARHFFSVSEIKSFIDLMAAHKLNILHLHLSDDEAFRVELPFYPSIKTIGNVRGFGFPMGPMMFPQGNLYKTYKEDSFVEANTTYAGTYNVKDLSEIIRYANLNQITVIPEIDFPAHSRALIKSMPDLFVDPQDKSKYVSAQGYSDDVLPVCTYNTNISVGPNFTNAINDIIGFVATLFNGQTTLYAIENEISIGGDEVSPNAWTASSSCKGEWKNLNSLQKSHNFFAEIAKSNPKIIFSGWQQFVQTDDIHMGKKIVPAKQVGHVWVWNTSEKGIPQAVSLINNGFPTVLAFSDKTYFDLVYTPDIQELGFAWATNWSDTYTALTSIEPVNRIEKTINSSEKLLGLEGALWSEHLASYDQLIYMAVPKMAGLSEAAWSSKKATSQGKKVNWKSLVLRLGCGEKGFLEYLSTVYGVGYRGYPEGIHLEVPQGVCR